MKYMVIAGASVFMLLGMAHMAGIVGSKPTGGPMTPIDPVVQEALQRPGGIGMAPELQTSTWRAWVGFNMSHALGIMVIAGLIIADTLTDFAAALDRPSFVVMTLTVPLAYLYVSVRYWFNKPTIGILVGGALLIGGVVSGLLA